MRSLLLLVMFCGLFMSASGCTVDRTWFQMNSNSPMPFFGFDLRFPRKTAQMEPLNPSKQLAIETDGSDVTRPVAEISDSRETKSKTQALQLPRITLPIGRRTEEELSLTGPAAPFVR